MYVDNAKKIYVKQNKREFSKSKVNINWIDAKFSKNFKKKDWRS